MSNVPCSDWGNGLSLMRTNLPERSASYRQRIPRTSRAQLLPAIRAPIYCASIEHEFTYLS